MLTFNHNFSVCLISFFFVVKILEYYDLVFICYQARKKNIIIIH